MNNPYLLIKINDYIKIRNKVPERLEKYKEIFIDPQVYQLKKQSFYDWEKTVNIKDFLDSLPNNHYFSADYPSDMNLQYSELFLRKSWENTLKYHNHKNYICTVQYKFNNYLSFLEWFDKFNSIEIKSGIMGLGNICRFRTLNEYLKHSLDYAFLKCRVKRVHIYGLCIRGIPYAYKLAKRFKIELSVDSTKWTRGITRELTSQYGVSCKTKHRQLYFDTYIQEIKKRGVKID